MRLTVERTPGRERKGKRPEPGSGQPVPRFRDSFCEGDARFPAWIRLSGEGNRALNDVEWEPVDSAERGFLAISFAPTATFQWSWGAPLRLLELRGGGAPAPFFDLKMPVKPGRAVRSSPLIFSAAPACPRRRARGKPPGL